MSSPQAPPLRDRSDPLALWPVRVAVHSLSWLLVANLVGMLMATLLLLPDAGSLLGPLTYGRWATLHLDLQLYGWCALPLVGLLLGLSFEPRSSNPLPRAALALWSGSLLFGSLSWLAGSSSGKLFLEWRGAARGLFFLALAALAAILAVGWLRQAAQRRADMGGGTREAGGSRPGRLSRRHRGLLLAALLPLPFVLYGAAGRDLYPPVNPHSGGATGTSLLGSALGIVLILLLLPRLLRLERKGPRDRIEILFGLHVLGFLLLGHGDRSHHEVGQVAALASVALWWPLLIRDLKRYDWPQAVRPWLFAAAAWGALLLADGILAFLPGVLETWKFTNALVAHGHLAMAGLWTSLGAVILDVQLDEAATRSVFGDRAAFLLWHGGTLLMVAALTVLGTLEGLRPGFLQQGSSAVPGFYGLRWAAGAAMLAASGRWLRGALDGGAAS